MKTRYRNGMVMLIIMSLLTVIGGCGEKNQEEAQTGVNVETAVVKTMDITRYSSYSGKVKGSHEEEVLPKQSRRVTSVYVTEGQEVRQGQVIVSLDRSKLDAAVQQAEASLEMAQAAQRSASLNLERVEQLAQQGVVSQNDLDAARAASEQADAQVKQAQAALNLARQNLADCDVVSPMDGIVGRVDVSVGDTTSTQSPVAVINDTSDLEVEVKVSESDVSSIQAGADVKVLVKAIGEEPFTGTVRSVASVADSNTRTYPVKVSLPNNPEEQVKSGMFAEVILGTKQRSGVTVVPMDAVLPKNGENIVYVVNGENRAQAVIVQTGINDGTYTEITKGLQAGQRVVTKGNTLIDETSVLNLTDGGTAK